MVSTCIQAWGLAELSHVTEVSSAKVLAQHWLRQAGRLPKLYELVDANRAVPT